MRWRGRRPRPGAPAESSMGLPNWNSLRLRRKLRIPQHRAVLLQRKHHDRAGVVHFDAAQLFINLQHLYRAGRLALGQDARSLLRLPCPNSGHSHVQQHAFPVERRDASEDNSGQSNRRRNLSVNHHRLQPKNVACGDALVRIGGGVAHRGSCVRVQHERASDTEHQLKKARHHAMQTPQVTASCAGAKTA